MQRTVSGHGMKPGDPSGGWVGRPVPRSEDLRFVTGRGRYVDDLKFPDMLHAVVVRSTHAHARLRGIDASAALALPGVAAVFTFADVAACAAPIPIRTGPLEGTERYLQRPLAEDRVRYVGEPVALVVARDRYVAEDAAELVAVDYEPLPAVVDVAAARADRTLLFPETGTNRACAYRIALGDADAAFARADYVRSETFRCHRHGAVPLETRGLVCLERDGTLEVWGATKVPFWNRRTLAEMLKRPVESIAMIEVDVGGSFGARGEFYPEDLLVPFAALALGRPVKWIEDRREHLMASNHSREMECELAVALARDGTLLGLRGRLAADMGAYTRTNGGVVPAKAAQFLLGPYRLRHFACDVELAMTNKTPVGTYRAPGRFEANFFRERLFDIACAELGIDRVAFRERNLLRSDELPWSIGKTVPYEPETEYDTGDYPGLFRRALEAFDYAGRMRRAGEAHDGRLQGVGFGCFVESSGAGPAETARVVARGKGRFDLYTGISSAGQGHETTLAQILADTLGAPLAAITVHHGSTGLVPQGFGTFHSRAVVVGGSAVKLAGEKLVAQLAALGGERWADALDLDALAAAAHPALEAVATFEVAKRTYTYGVHLCHVAVDPETAQVEVLDYLSTEDVGRAVNPLVVHGQALGAAVQGLGGVFLDEFRYDAEGQLLTGSLADLMPTANEFPRVSALSFEESPSRLNPLGAKGAGEGGIVAVGAAVGNAVAHALAPLGVAITAMPLSLENLAGALRAARGKKDA
jgi:carbon-monoxide dehydrogenase large subunit